MRTTGHRRRVSVIDISEETTIGEHRKQVSLELWHPGCWTLDTTGALEGAEIIVNSANRMDTTINVDVILITDDTCSVGELLAAIDEHDAVNTITLLKRTDHRARAIVNYDRATSISPKIINSDFVPLEPVYITGGYEYWTVMVRGDQLGSKIQQMQDECDIDIRSIREFDPEAQIEFADIVDRIHNHLTERQTECLRLAWEKGYYNWPRENSAEQIAGGMNITAPTFLEHLRKGEQKVIRTILGEISKRHRSVPSRRMV